LDYITIAKECVDQLVVIGKPVDDDDDLITYFIGGLNSTFNPFIASFSFATRENSLTLEDFQAELLSYEALLENQNKSIPPDASQIAFRAQNRGAHYPCKSKGHPFKPFPKNSLSNVNMHPHPLDFQEPYNMASKVSHTIAFKVPHFIAIKYPLNSDHSWILLNHGAWFEL
jgi:hypothetical protein